MLVRDMATECALMVHDVAMNEILRSQWLMFIRSAGMDARSSGWLVDLEDSESLTVANDTWEYTVPAGFAYIEKIMLESTVNGTSVYIDAIPNSHWEPRLNGSAPVISFATQTSLDVGMHLKVIGQARPTIYIDENEVIDRGMEAFIRERTLYFAFRFMGAGLSELARWRQQMSTQAWQTSEMMLQRHPQEMRVRPSSRAVQGRG